MQFSKHSNQYKKSVWLEGHRSVVRQPVVKVRAGAAVEEMPFRFADSHAHFSKNLYSLTHLHREKYHPTQEGTLVRIFSVAAPS